MPWEQELPYRPQLHPVGKARRGYPGFQHLSSRVCPSLGQSTLTVSPCLLALHRSLLLAAERPETTHHQPPTDQRWLGHPVPHRRCLLQVQLRWQNLLHQGGQHAEGRVWGRSAYREVQERSLALHWGRVVHFMEQTMFSNSGVKGLKLWVKVSVSAPAPHLPFLLIGEKTSIQCFIPCDWPGDKVLTE